MPGAEWRPLFLFLHVLSVLIWVGGMAFAYLCLRPAAVEILDAPQRLRLWCAVFKRFFPLVWAALAALWLSGLCMLLPGGMAFAPKHWHVMLTLGTVMTAIYLRVYFKFYVALRQAVANENWPAGGAALGKIRQWVGINLLLGFVTVATATLGWWFAG